MLLTIITFFIILSVLVLVHEFGHFLLAKKAGIKVEEFGFGLPPKVVSLKFGETVYSLNWLPFGGFVRLYGEELENEKIKMKNEKREAGEIRKRVKPQINQKTRAIKKVGKKLFLLTMILFYLKPWYNFD